MPPEAEQASTLASKSAPDEQLQLSEQNRELHDRLQKVLTDDPEIAKKLAILQSHPDLLADLAKVESDPAERGAFLEKLKGYGQVVKLKDGTQYTFAEILEIGKKDATKEEEILAAIPDEQRRQLKGEYRKWKAGNTQEDVARLSERVGTKKEDVARLGVDIDGMRRINDDLGEINKKAESLFGQTSFENIKTRALAEAKSIPQLKDATPEQIQKRDFDNVIIGHYLVAHRQELSAAPELNTPEKRQEFMKITDELNRKLGGVAERVASREELNKRIDATVLGYGTNAEALKSAGGNWIEQGYNNVSYNNQTREFTFQNEKGETRVINIAGQVAQESIRKDGLSISREMEIPKPDPLQKDKEQLSSDTKNLTSEIQKNIAPAIGDDPTSEVLKQADKLMGTHAVQVLGAIESELFNKSRKIEEKIREFSNPLQQSEVEALKKVLRMNEEHIKKIQDLRKRAIELAESEKTDKRNKGNEDGKFEQVAGYNIKALTSLKYHEIGQQNMQRMVDAINIVHKDKPGFSPIELGKEKISDTQLQKLTLAIANIARSVPVESTPSDTDKKGSEEKKPNEKKANETTTDTQKWQNVDRADHIIAAREIGSGLFAERLQNLRTQFNSGGKFDSDSKLQKAIIGENPT